MAGPRDLVVRFLADVQGFLRGTDQVEDALRDTARQQDQLADSGEDSARRLAQAYDRAADKISRDARDARRDVKRAYADTGKEAGQEFAQNLGESVSSGDVGGLLSGTAGGLAATFGATGPIGLALAGLSAVAVGVFSAMQKQAEQAATAAQLAFDQLHEATSREARLNAVLSDRFGSTLAGWEAIQRYADASGYSAEAIADALVSGGPKARTMADQFDRMLKAAYETDGTLDRTNSVLIDGADDLRDRAVAMERAAAAAQTERDALKVSEGILRRSAAFYATRGSAYAPGGSAYDQQLGAAARYARGGRG